MRSNRKFLALGGMIWLIALVTTAFIRGEPGKPAAPGKNIEDNGPGVNKPINGLDVSRFADRPVITYQGKDGKQYVAIVATGGSFVHSPPVGDSLVVFARPSLPSARMAFARMRLSASDTKRTNVG